MSFVERTNFPTLARPEAHLHRGAEIEKGSVTADQLAATIPRGELGYSQTTTSVTFDAETDVVSVTVTVGTNRKVRITAGPARPSLPNANDICVFRIKEGSTELMRVDETIPSAGVGEGKHISVRLTPSAGSHTYKTTLTKAGGAGNGNTNAAAGNPAYILVEDIGGT